MRVREYELWHSLRDSSYTLCVAHNKPKDLDIDATLVKIFTASSWEDARRQQHEFLERYLLLSSPSTEEEQG